MNYIYDVILNLRSKYYDFFFWEEDDEITHISKIPVIKVNKKTIESFLKNDIIVDNKILSTIENKTTLYKFNNKTIKYLAIFTDSNYTIALEFDNTGKSVKRSSLLFDEEYDALNISKNMTLTIIEYTIHKSIKNNNLMTRKEEKNYYYLKNKILNIKEDLETLKYIYYELFLKLENNSKVIFNSIIKLLKENNQEKINKLRELLLLIDTKIV